MLRKALASAAILLAFIAEPYLSRPYGRSARYAPGQIIVKLKDSHGQLETIRAQQISELLGAKSSEPLLMQAPNGRLSDLASRHGLDRIFLLKFDAGADIGSIIAQLEASGQIEYAEPNYLIKLGGSCQYGSQDDSPLPDDPRFPDQWGLRNPGLTVEGFPATLCADISALDAWKITTGSPEVIIALTDTGVDITHPDLAPNIYTNPREIPNNNLDDDGNGFVDDVHGYNVADNNGDISDVVGHGTQMAGIISAAINNGIGISGVTQSKLMPVKFFRRTRSSPLSYEGTVADAARAILYSIAAGAAIINASWTTLLEPGLVPPEAARALRDAVQAANDVGILMVCIAGNEGFNNDINPVYPGHYQLPNQIVVAASDFNDQIWHPPDNPFEIKSGFGPNTVHLAAPGVSVLTTRARGDCADCSRSSNPDDWYTIVSGTSASAAFVSGAAALVKSKYPEANAYVIRRRILESVDVKDGLRGLVVTSGRLNAAAALTIQLPVNPPSLRKVKYKPGGQKLLLFGEGFQRGAVALVGNSSYSTEPRSEDLSSLLARVPLSALPEGVTVQIRVRNPDGGTSQPIPFTR
jgi:subtilisin family serine protease